MLKLGKEKVIWGVFGISILITAFALYLVLNVYSGKIYQIFFLVMAIVISVTQFFVAFANYKRKQNWLTKILLRRKHYK